MAMFIQMFVDHQASLQVKVLENGNQEVVLLDDAGKEIVLSFERKFNTYVCQGSCRITNKNLVNLMRKAVAAFKGSATVHRIYETYVMIYEYEQGSVVKIVECKGDTERLIYEYKDTLGLLEQLFRKTEVEHEIEMIKAQINTMLDLRNDMEDVAVRGQIDERLTQLTHRLFVLEA
ncbi:non-ribosomal peptide synthetase module [Paenibacillus rigui]|uniref:Non-ribosomal peptide synthetase module n=2 Tax=Paenibacillus rigui TaxID=554312 RepID=A0A229UTI3_9BACL|nr:non-ribosomal peptide synthetase module [Paenibacillus rigui]